MVSPKWKKGALLGKGGNATVSLAIFDDDKLLAVKFSRSSDHAHALKREKQILEDLDGCSQIIHCYGDDFTINESGESTYCIFLDYTPLRSLFDYMKTSKVSLSERKVRRFTRSMLKGLVHIHSKGYVHCDIKPQNVLVWSSTEVKITDFGLAKRAGVSLPSKRMRGTPIYIAPEGMEHGEYEKPSDIWSLGCTVFEMLTGRTAMKEPYNVGCRVMMAELPETMSEEGKDFLRRCLVEEPERRWTAEMLLMHPFVCSGLEEEKPRWIRCRIMTGIIKIIRSLVEL